MNTHEHQDQCRLQGTQPISIRASGLVSPLGDDLDSFFESLLAGDSAIVETSRTAAPAAPHAAFDPSAILSGRSFRPYDRTSLFTIAAAAGALAEFENRAGDEHADVLDLGLVLGSTFSSARTMAEFDRRCLERGPGYASPMDFANTVINAASGQAAIWHRLTGLNSTLTGGASVGLRAIIHACDILRAGRSRLLLAGGVDEISPESTAALARARVTCLGHDGADQPPRPIPFDRERNGIAAGEGAALLLLEPGATAAIGILGYSVGFDPLRGRSQDSLTEALATTIGRALGDAGCPAEQIDALSAAGNGSLFGDRVEAEAIHRALGAEVADHLPVCAVKAATGEPFGAGGAYQVITASAMIAGHCVPGIAGWRSSDLPLRGLSATLRTPSSPIRRVLVDSFDDDGCCCALVVGRLQEK